jgi:hypothetical protein
MPAALILEASPVSADAIEKIKAILWDSHIR